MTPSTPANGPYVTSVAHLEPWLDKRALAAHLGCGVRWLELRTSEGMPHSLIAGRLKFRVSLVEPWLEQRGFITHRGDHAA